MNPSTSNLSDRKGFHLPKRILINSHPRYENYPPENQEVEQPAIQTKHSRIFIKTDSCPQPAPTPLVTSPESMKFALENQLWNNTNIEEELTKKNVFSNATPFIETITSSPDTHSNSSSSSDSSTYSPNPLLEITSHSSSPALLTNTNKNMVKKRKKLLSSIRKLKLWDHTKYQLSKKQKKLEKKLFQSIEMNDLLTLQKYLVLLQSQSSSLSPCPEETTTAEMVEDSKMHHFFHIKNSNGETLFTLACAYGNDQILHLLLSTLHRSSQSYEEEKQQQAYRNHTLMERSNAGMTPLYIVCDKGYTLMVKQLLPYQSLESLRLTTTTGLTAFHIACKKNNKEIIQLLWEYQKVKINEKNELLKTHQSMTSTTSTTTSPETIEYLINMPTSCHLQITPLIIASMYGYEDLIDYLLKEKVQLYDEDQNGNLALHYACRHGYLSIVHKLIEAGMDPSMPNCYEETCMDIAIEYKHHEIMEYIQHVLHTRSHPNHFAFTSLYTPEQFQELLCNAYEREKNVLTQIHHDLSIDHESIEEEEHSIRRNYSSMDEKLWKKNKKQFNHLLSSEVAIPPPQQQQQERMKQKKKGDLENTSSMLSTKVTATPIYDNRLRDPVFLRILMKNRMKYAQFLILGTIEEDKPFEFSANLIAQQEGKNFNMAICA